MIDKKPRFGVVKLNLGKIPCKINPFVLELSFIEISEAGSEVVSLTLPPISFLGSGPVF